MVEVCRHWNGQLPRNRDRPLALVTHVLRRPQEQVWGSSELVLLLRSGKEQNRAGSAQIAPARLGGDRCPRLAFPVEEGPADGVVDGENSASDFLRLIKNASMPRSSA